MAIKLQQLGLRFGRAWIFANVSWQVEDGQILWLSGRNGAGKTTLLKVLATLIPSTVGRAWVADLDVRDQQRQLRNKIGFLTHRTHHYVGLSARDNLQIVARLLAVKQHKFALDRVLERVGLIHQGDLPVALFSAGMKKRLALARLLLMQPEVWLLDEPFGQLDCDGMAMVSELIDGARAQGKTVVLVTHDRERGEALADQHIDLTALSYAGAQGSRGMVPQP